MLSIKRILLILPILILMMMFSARAVYAEPPPKAEDAEAGLESGQESAYEEALTSSNADTAAGSGGGNSESVTDVKADPAAGEKAGPAAGAESESGNIKNHGDDSESRSTAGSETDLRGSVKPVDLIICCNVKGSLGDLSKRFRYVLKLRGLAPDSEYAVTKDHADMVSGFSGDGFKSDSDGNAELSFGLGDENSIKIIGMPAGTVFDVCEKANDHTPEYLVTAIKSAILSARGPSGRDLYTGNVRMDSEGSNYTVDFTNSRVPAPVTGLPGHSPLGDSKNLITGFAIFAILAVIYITDASLLICL